MPHPPEGSQLAPSQFAYFKPVQPSTTSSGIIPGQAPLDTPSPSRPPSPPLERSQRTRKPMARKIEATGKKNGKSAGKPSNSGPSDPTSIPGPQVSDARVATQPDEEIESAQAPSGYDGQDEEEDYEYVYETAGPTIVEQLEEILGHGIEHLNNQELQELFEKAKETQALAMGTQVESTTSAVPLFAQVLLAGRERNPSPSHQGPSNYSLSKTPNELFLSSQKRNLDASAPNIASKRACTATAVDNTATESESSSSDSDASRRRASSSDSDSEREVAPPLPRPPTKPRTTTSVTAHPKSLRPAPASRVADPPTCPSAIAPANPPACNPVASTSNPNPRPVASHLLHDPPPINLNNNEALIQWALRLVAQQSQGASSSSASLNPRRQEPNQPQTTSTTNHVIQAIANHRTAQAATEHSGSQANIGSSPHANATPHTSHGSASTPAADTSQKKKRRKKTKIG
ncbi:hypothetical protein RhiJN_21728 [Ceratobasidium sp. AG-Ba]|nr:hypothetical protein RhiJN_21728 [Ceratobasidium sp. AG-Ba]